jgi:phosphate transport system protein
MRLIDEGIREIRQSLMLMAQEVAGSLRNALTALHRRDPDLAKTVLDREQEIDAREVEIDERCLNLLARYQPEAGDLRFITMAMQINNDLERIGDHAVNLAHRTLDLIRIGLPSETLEVIAMGEAAAEVLEEATLCFLNQDRALVQKVLSSDDAMDQRRDHIFRTILDGMMSQPESVEARIHLLLISRDIERVADLSTNIAEDVHYILTGETVKHHLKPRPEE